MTTEIKELSLDKLKIHNKNKKFFDDIKGPEYEVFKKSIKEDGVITPIIVAPDMTIISGHQRYKASCELKLQSIPAIIDNTLITEEEKLRKLLISNFGRAKNNPMKQSRVIVQYEKLNGIRRGNPVLFKIPPNKKQSEIAAELGISIDTLKRLKNLQRLSPEVQYKIEKEELTYTTALKIFGVLSFEEQKKIIENFSGKDMTGITAPQLKQMILEEDFTWNSENEKILNMNKKLRALCTHLVKEVSNGTSNIIEIKKKCKEIITERNKEYLQINIKSMKQQITLLEEYFSDI